MVALKGDFLLKDKNFPKMLFHQDDRRQSFGVLIERCGIQPLLVPNDLDQFLIAIAINKVAFQTWSKFHLIKFRPSQHNLIFFKKMM